MVLFSAWTEEHFPSWLVSLRDKSQTHKNNVAQGLIREESWALMLSSWAASTEAQGPFPNQTQAHPPASCPD